MEITLPNEAIVEVVAGTELTINGPADMNTYEWSVALAPKQSTAEPAPVDEQTTVYTPDLPGNYRVHLEVFGDGENQDLRLRVVSPKTRKAPPTPGEFKEFGGWGGPEGLRGIYMHLEESLGNIIGFYPAFSELPLTADMFDGAVAWVQSAGWYEYNSTVGGWFPAVPQQEAESATIAATSATFTLQYTPSPDLRVYRNGLLTDVTVAGKELTFDPVLEVGEELRIYYTQVPD